jgi:putative IMPACT (imprinted ancient) family translation regulator
MLDVLLHSGMGEIAAVVTRYFGGVKLGKGGLVRAYGGAVQHALATLPTVLRVQRVELTITVGYSDIDAARRTLEESGAELLNERYDEAVHYIAAVPVAQADNLALLLADRTAGRADVTGGEDS